MARTRHGSRLRIAVALFALLTLPGCQDTAHVSYIPEGGEYSADDLEALLDGADMESAQRTDPEGIAEARQQALADLRTHGDGASALADALTSQFPVDVNAVPIEVHHAVYEDEPAWIVVEAWGDPGASLSDVRLWVFSTESLDLITAHAR